MKVPFSVVILTFNEELNIRYALESVALCDNVVVIDSFSTDRTEQICRQFDNVTFVQHPFENLARQRQFALDSGLVRHDWVLALDADEMLPEDLRSELIEIARTGVSEGPVAYDIAMRFVMWGRWLKYSSEYPIYWRRFFRRDRVRYVQRGHADTVDVDGSVGRTRHDLIHEDRKGLSDWLSKHNRYTTQEALYALNELRQVPLGLLFASDRQLRRRVLKKIFRFTPFSGTLRFLYLYVFRLGFLDGAPGYRLCVLRAHQAYLVQLKMLELRTSARQSELGNHERERSRETPLEVPEGVPQ